MILKVYLMFSSDYILGIVFALPEVGGDGHEKVFDIFHFDCVFSSGLCWANHSGWEEK